MTAMSAIPPRSSTTARLSRNTRRLAGAFDPATASTPSEGDVRRGRARPSARGARLPAANARYTRAGLESQTCEGIDGPAWEFAPGGAASASAVDVAGNVTTAMSAFTVVVDETGLCDLVKQFSSREGVAKSLCVKLANAADAEARGDTVAADNMHRAFTNEVAAQTGEALTQEEADVLTRLVGLL
jgi:hypothetical protein